MGVRGRTVVVGVDQVRRSVLKGKVKLAVVAPDAARNSLDKVLPLLEARHVRVMEAPSARELGEAVGRESTVAVGILDAGLARGVAAVGQQLAASSEWRKKESKKR
ncbi:MAG: ribosomal L7Ae/L30e/S12e/Gadd45 family protein [Gemmatimonadaceae bacterium]|nr:ribosomal L7Ae/L30e/S12e/Gadd45 family protein [Gemmatimonadaceae bacterium]